MLEHEDAEWSKMYSWTRCDTEKSIDILEAKFKIEAKSLSLLRSNLIDGGNLINNYIPSNPQPPS